MTSLAASSYNPATVVPGGLAAERARLERQAALSFSDELPILKRALAGRSRLLEVGAGCGAITRRLRAAFARMELIALDHDPALLDSVSGADRVLCADAREIPLPGGSVDAVYLRYVLQHVPDRERVLAEATRALAPGGVLLVTEVDAELWGVADPPAAPGDRMALRRAYGALDALQRRAGGDRLIARRLTRQLAGVGLEQVTLQPFCTTSDQRPIGDFEVHLGPQRWAPLVAAGDLSPAEFALITRQWRTFAADPRAWVMLLGFTAIGHRPVCDPAGHRHHRKEN